ncbi:PREDICTED: lisH domain-containing protein C1711.05-like [Camelina sativa]|uniref:LisH domain-containing protein C1711.05-like n=1 Tax=Camelina sativa TaxID=90675 RepID=A0ABM0XGG7_CAMSA|nr:PREDICTED: lisH domain-containing protein C1711.05-like [Camelina sativa]
MDFDSLPRRDLQFFCKRNKIPANMTNIAMADALKSLEIVEGIDDFMNQSPTSVARTAARTTRKKATKDDTQSSDLVTRSCYVGKSLAGEMEQENRDTNMLLHPSVAQGRRRAAATSVAVKLDVTDAIPEVNVSKTPAARSTRRAQAAASCKKDESVQRVYSTRRSVRLLEESMADLSLKSVNVPAKKHEDAEREDSPAGSKFQAKSDEISEKVKAEGVVSVRDLNDSMEKEWDGSKNDSDLDILYGDLGDITFFDASTSKEQMNGTDSNTVSASDSFVLVQEQETSQEDDFVVVDHAASTSTANTLACNKESETEQMKIDSESDSDETEYETDQEEGDAVAVAVDTNQEAFDSKVSAGDNVSMVDSVTTVLIADESKEVDEIASEEELEVDSDEWSEYEIDEVELEENSCGSEESIDTESEEAPLSDKKTPDSSSSSSTLAAGNETKTPLSPSEAESIVESKKKNKEDAVEMGLNINGEGEAEAEAKKKTKKKKITAEESFKDVSVRQLIKLVKELDIKSKQQQQHKGAK